MSRDYHADPLIRSLSIRAKCLDCMCDNAAEVRRCDIRTCALWPWRMGAGRPDALRAPQRRFSETQPPCGHPTPKDGP
jgi:hypothetical protein